MVKKPAQTDPGLMALLASKVTCSRCYYQATCRLSEPLPDTHSLRRCIHYAKDSIGKTIQYLSMVSVEGLAERATTGTESANCGSDFPHASDSISKIVSRGRRQQVREPKPVHKCRAKHAPEQKALELEHGQHRPDIIFLRTHV